METFQGMLAFHQVDKPKVKEKLAMFPRGSEEIKLVKLKVGKENLLV